MAMIGDRLAHPGTQEAEVFAGEGEPGPSEFKGVRDRLDAGVGAGLIGVAARCAGHADAADSGAGRLDPHAASDGDRARKAANAGGRLARLRELLKFRGVGPEGHCRPALLVAVSGVCAPANRSRITTCTTPERSTMATATWKPSARHLASAACAAFIAVSGVSKRRGVRGPDPPRRRCRRQEGGGRRSWQVLWAWQEFLGG